MKQNDIIRDEIEQFLRQKAPGLRLTFQENPAFDSLTLGLGLKVDHKQLVGNQQIAANPKIIGDYVMKMLAEVQKAAVTAIGLEEYVRERELAVLDRLQERLDTGYIDGKPSTGDPLQEERQALGG